MLKNSLTHNHRGILTVLVSAALLAAAAITAAVWYYPRLPDPAHANRRDLIRWLVTRDLEREPMATREVLALRLEEEFSGEIDWSATAGELTERHRQRLCENVGRLVGPWMRQKAVQYALLPPEEGGVYLDRLIDTLEHWRGLDALAPKSDAGGSAQPGLMDTARRQLDALQAQGSSAEQRELKEFVAAVQTRWAMRELSDRFERAAGAWFEGLRSTAPAN